MTEKPYMLCLKDPGDDGAQRLAGIIIDRIRSHDILGRGSYLWSWAGALVVWGIALRPGHTVNADDFTSLVWSALASFYAYCYTRHHRQSAFNLRCALMSVENDAAGLEAMMADRIAKARPMGRVEAWVWDQQSRHHALFVILRWAMPGDVFLSRMWLYSQLRYECAMSAIDRLGTPLSEAQAGWHRYRCNESRARIIQSQQHYGGRGNL